MNELIEQGASAFKSGDIATARKLLTEAVQKFPDNERAWGWLYNVATSDHERFLCLKQMVRINPDNKKAQNILMDLEKNIPNPEKLAEIDEPRSSSHQQQEAIIPTDIQPQSHSANNIATALQIIAVLTYGGGLISGLVFANVEIPYLYIAGTHTEFSFTIALIYWASGFISGSVFLGFAEIINLLQQLVDLNKKNNVNISNNGIDNNSEQYNDLPRL